MTLASAPAASTASASSSTPSIQDVMKIAHSTPLQVVYEIPAEG